MYGSLYDDVKRSVKKWRPKKSYSKETEYRDDLIEYLRKELNRPKIPYTQAPQHVIKKETGRSHADIDVDRKIGIELKRNLKGKTEMDRVLGQLEEYISEYENVILVLCGEVKEETFEEIRYRVKKMVSKLGPDIFLPGPKVSIVRKDKEALKVKKSNKPPYMTF